MEPFTTAARVVILILVVAVVRESLHLVVADPRGANNRASRARH